MEQSEEFDFEYVCDECHYEETCEEGCKYFMDMIDNLIESFGVDSTLESIGYEVVRNLDITEKQNERLCKRLLTAINQSGNISY